MLLETPPQKKQPKRTKKSTQKSSPSKNKISASKEFNEIITNAKGIC